MTLADKVPVIGPAPSLSSAAKLKCHLWENALIGDKQEQGCGEKNKRLTPSTQTYHRESDVLDHLLAVCLTD